MYFPPPLLAHALTGLTVATTAPIPDQPVPAIQLPSDEMRGAMHIIALSDFSVIPGPEFEGVLHGALFRSTEHLYDL